MVWPENLKGRSKKITKIIGEWLGQGLKARPIKTETKNLRSDTIFSRFVFLANDFKYFPKGK